MDDVYIVLLLSVIFYHVQSRPFARMNAHHTDSVLNKAPVRAILHSTIRYCGMDSLQSLIAQATLVQSLIAQAYQRMGSGVVHCYSALGTRGACTSTWGMSSLST